MGACALIFFALGHGMNENLIRSKTKAKKLAMILTSLLFVSVPFLVVGALLMALNIVFFLGVILLVIGIALLLANIYAVPNAWMIHKKFVNMETLVNLIEKDNITSFSQLQDILKISDSELRSLISICRAKQYIGDVVIEGEEVKEKKYYVCPNCGETIKDIESISFCPYCGSKIEKITIDK